MVLFYYFFKLSEGREIDAETERQRLVISSNVYRQSLILKIHFPVGATLTV